MALPLGPVGREEWWGIDQTGLASESAGPYEASRTGGEGPKLRFLSGRGEIAVNLRPRGTRSLGVWMEDIPPGFWSKTLMLKLCFASWSPV